MQNNLEIGQLALGELKDRFKTNFKNGLNDEEVLKRQRKFGLNALEEEHLDSFVDKIARQFKSPLVVILFVAGVVTMALSHYLDASVIFFALAINVFISLFQEGKAGKSFEKLKNSQEKTAQVLRSGRKKKVLAKELVSGDIIFIEAGSYIPSDARILESIDLSVNESILTGEWIGVEKNAIQTKEKISKSSVLRQKNMLWMGTLVTLGRAKAVVVATGGDTKLGEIAESLKGREESTPLQKSIKKLSKFLTIFIILALAGVFLLGVYRGGSPVEMFIIAIAIAVAVMPEGLPSAVTVVLAIGMEAILKKGGLVRNLLSAETLGGTTVILTDKTGTLTKGQMAVAGISTWGTFQGALKENLDERDVLEMAVLTTDAYVENYDDETKEWVVRGRPVERAIALAGLERAVRQEDLFKTSPRLDFLPFQSARRFSGSLHSKEGEKKNQLYMVGAPEVLLRASKFIYFEGKKIKITKEIRERVKKEYKKITESGMRLIGVAFQDTNWKTIPAEAKSGVGDIFDNSVFGGFVIIHDPIRKGVKESITKAKGAGAQVIMLTGDNQGTAGRVAIETGIKKEGDDILTGDDISEFSDKELLEKLKRVKVFARMLPEQKLRVVVLLKKQGEVVAMTGDGINDAPALRRADVGVALGSGTDVAKEASDLILLNNSFSVIVSAIEEGRRILDNLKKIVVYLLSTSTSEFVVIIGAFIVGMPLPILPTQILWTNIVEEGFMNFAFAFEPAEKDIMKRNPSSPTMKDILTKRLRELMIIISLVTGFVLIVLYFFLSSLDMPIKEIRTIMFVALSLDSIFFTFSIKDLKRPLWKINIFSNWYLLGALGISISALLAALFVPFLRKMLSLVQLSGVEFLWIMLLGLFNLFLIEILKYWLFRKK